MTVSVDEFEALRPHLQAVAYRLTGTFADAEDAVQDAWLRWHDVADRTEIVNLRAWLTTVVSRLCLDRLRSAASRRETYVGQWLPEPVVTPFDQANPLARVVADEDARYAATVVLELLSPDQRIAFVLHDGFGVPFTEIAAVLDINADAARQLASRARRTVSKSPVPPRDSSHDDVVGQFVAAMATGDLAAVVAVLHPDATFTGDANRRAPTAARVIQGPDKVARFLLALAQRYGPRFFEVGLPAHVNGELGLYSLGAPATVDWPQLHPRVTAFTVRDGKIWAVWDVANPEKFSASPLHRAR